ncbi:unnamed protein product, partial [Amoebophrya sp. A25]|eukprot:GSA25T00011381001.1
MDSLDAVDEEDEAGTWQQLLGFTVGREALLGSDGDQEDALIRKYSRYQLVSSYFKNAANSGSDVPGGNSSAPGRPERTEDILLFPQPMVRVGDFYSSFGIRAVREEAVVGDISDFHKTPAMGGRQLATAAQQSGGTGEQGNVENTDPTTTSNGPSEPATGKKTRAELMVSKVLGVAGTGKRKVHRGLRKSSGYPSALPNIDGSPAQVEHLADRDILFAPSADSIAVVSETDVKCSLFGARKARESVFQELETMQSRSRADLLRSFRAKLKDYHHLAVTKSGGGSGPGEANRAPKRSSQSTGNAANYYSSSSDFGEKENGDVLWALFPRKEVSSPEDVTTDHDASSFSSPRVPESAA